MTNKYCGFMIIDSHENLHLALCLTHCLFLNFSNTHTHKMLFNSDSLQCQGIFLGKLAISLHLASETDFDKIQAVTDLGCLCSNKNYYLAS